MEKPFGRITANLNVIYPGYDPAKFVGREWLINKVTQFRDSPDGRQLIIVGEPGSGKSNFVAYLAETLNCPRHFIRVDNISGVTGADPRAFLLSIGAQLCQKYGREIFEQGESTKTRVTVGLAKDQAEVVGRMIDEMYTLPFLPKPESEVQVQVVAATGQSRVVGEHVKRMINVTLALDELTLLHVAVIQPLKRIQQLYPDERVVLLIDALDESLQHPGRSIPDVIPTAADQDFPDNLRLVMTSRPGNHLASFRKEDLLRLDDKESGNWKETLKDARDYIGKRLSQEPLAGTLAAMSPEKSEAFIEEIETRSDGNFLFLYHFMNAVTEGIKKGETDLEQFPVPADLDEIYRFFAMERIRKNPMDLIHFTVDGPIIEDLQARWQGIEGVEKIVVAGMEATIITQDIDPVLPRLFDLANAAHLKISDLKTQRGTQLGTWEEKYLPVLGVLAVAFEALSRVQLADFSGVEVEYVDSIIAQLLQFLDTININSSLRYRLYHRDFAEYLLDSARNLDWLLDSQVFHRKIAFYYLGERRSWSEVDWNAVKEGYPFRHLAAHLLSAGNPHELFTLINKGWLDAQFVRSFSDRPFASDTELAIQAALESINPDTLIQIIRNSFILSTLRSLTTDIPLQALVVLAELGQQERAFGYAELIQNSSVRIEAYCQIGIALANIHKLDDALETLKRAYRLANSIGAWSYRLSEPSGTSAASGLASVAEALIQIGDPERTAANIADRSVKLALEVSNGSRNSILASVVSKLAQAGLIDLAMGAIQAIDEDYDRTKPYAILVDFLVRAGQADRVIAWCSEIPSDWWRIMHRVGIVNALVLAGDGLRARQVAEQAASDAESYVHKWPKAPLLAQAARALANSGEREGSIQTANKAAVMAETWEGPDGERIWVQAGVIRGLAQANLIQRAKEMYAAIESVSNEPSEQRAKGWALWQIAVSTAEAGDGETALELAQKAQLLLQTFHDSGNTPLEYAFPELSVMDGSKLYKSPIFDVIMVIASQGRVDQAISEASANLGQLELFSLFSEMVDMLLSRGEIDRAVAIVENLSETGLRAQAWAKIATAWLREGQVIQATKAVDQAITEIRRISNPWNRTWALEGVTEEFVRQNQLDRAEATVESIIDPEIKAWAYLDICKAFINVEEPQKIIELANRALAVANQSKTIPDPSFLFRSQAIMLPDDTLKLLVHKRRELIGQGARRALSSGEWIGPFYIMDQYNLVAMILPEVVEIITHGVPVDQAGLILEQIISHELSTANSEDRDLMTAQLAGALARTGWPERAWSISQSIQHPLRAIHASAVIAAAFSLAGQKEKGLPAAEKAWMQSLSYRGESFYDELMTKIIVALAQGGLLDRAWKTPEDLDILIQSLRRTPGLVANVNRSLGQGGDYSRAEALINQVLETDEVNPDLLIEGARAFAIIKNIDRSSELLYKAKESSERISDLRTKSEILIKIAQIQFDLGLDHENEDLLDKAAKVVKDIENPQERATMQVEITKKLADLGKVDQALVVAESISSPAFQVNALLEVRLSLAQIGQMERAVELANRMYEIVQGIEDPVDQAFSWVTVSLALGGVGEGGNAVLADINAFLIAAETERSTFFSILQKSAYLLCSIDHCQSLWNVHEALLEVDQWWPLGSLTFV